MLKYLIENSDLKAILKFGPQNFFKAVDLLQIAGIVNQVRKKSQDQALWSQVSKKIQNDLLKSRTQIELNPVPEHSEREGFQLSLSQGESILTWFFFQIFSSQEWVIDFRKKSWDQDSQQLLIWMPKSLYFLPSEEFKKGLQNLYLGFYRDLPLVFDEGLNALGVFPARQILHQHFGQGDQTAVTFQLKQLESTFAQVFAQCAQSGVKVHAEFAAFGVMLLGLYETFESSGLQLNVRQAFERALVQGQERSE